MKKIILLLLICCSYLLQAQHTNPMNEYYLEVISNPSNSIHLTIGAYPQSISANKRADGTIFSVMKVALINNIKAQTFAWKDYKIYILTKSGELFYNFTTSASSGDYSCQYPIAPGETHIQFFCFEKLFLGSDIEKVWVSFADNQFIALNYFVDDKTKTSEEQAKQNIEQTSPTPSPAALPIEDKKKKK